MRGLVLCVVGVLLGLLGHDGGVVHAGSLSKTKPVSRQRLRETQSHKDVGDVARRERKSSETASDALSVSSSAVSPSPLSLYGGAAVSPTTRKKKKTAREWQAYFDKKQKPKGLYGAFIRPVMSRYYSVPLVTRLYLTMAALLTASHHMGAEPEMFALEKGRVVRALELWRPFTALAFYGKLSMSMALNLFSLIQYGKGLEKKNGSADTFIFLVTQATLLSLFGFALRMPFLGNCYASAVLLVTAMMEPMAPAQTVFGIGIKMWQIPFATMIVDVLQAQELKAAVPHLVGICTGYIYHYLTKTIPDRGGWNVLGAPKWLKWLMNKDDVTGVIKQQPQKGDQKGGGQAGSGSGGSSSSGGGARKGGSSSASTTGGGQAKRKKYNKKGGGAGAASTGS
uniref:Derlin n=1 Tax=Chromera velia CCMP2878 TaxID=1169474 RepID=A0A0G4I909_9ALVE|eukprot:Cvel_2018.t1-p1 / transcript=Cvel_2018.t1 / gene=Cvel_2018 / organism=Chromera_velia_CCMP2878 / gene_product=Derlin-1, putative / transcript_product=Derlin-1, putative / location=Cvel_scaffold77:97683-99302(+) / protein_length=395 / sequence_SO=supercontig / SO=protein_coding / is_pseudo=false